MKLKEIMKEGKWDKDIEIAKGSAFKENIGRLIQGAIKFTEKEISEGKAQSDPTIQKDLSGAKQALAADRYQAALMHLFFIFKTLGKLGI